LITLIAANIPRIVSYLEQQTAQTNLLETSYDVKIVPLGSLRLKLIELMYNLIKLNKDALLLSLVETNFFGQLSHLIEVYSWNNFLQLKSSSIFDEILDSANKQFAARALKSSNIGQVLINLGSKTSYDHQSTRTIR
jgi:hypothetical protein